MEEYNNQKNDVLEKFSKYKENLLSLPDEEKLVQNHEQLREEYFRISGEVVKGFSSDDSGVREQAILLSQNESYEGFDVAEDSLDGIGDLERGGGRPL